VEDLFEEIFGEMADEHDAGPTPGPPDTEGEVLSGLLHRHEVEESIGFEWPEGRYETLGGFLVARLGRFPDAGEIVRVDRWGFEILAMDGHRVARVKVHRLPPAAAGGTES